MVAWLVAVLPPVAAAIVIHHETSSTSCRARPQYGLGDTRGRWSGRGGMPGLCAEPAGVPRGRGRAGRWYPGRPPEARGRVREAAAHTPAAAADPRRLWSRARRPTFSLAGGRRLLLACRTGVISHAEPDQWHCRRRTDRPRARSRGDMSRGLSFGRAGDPTLQPSSQASRRAAWCTWIRCPARAW
jgi:hypothetical protein